MTLFMVPWRPRDRDLVPITRPAPTGRTPWTGATSLGAAPVSPPDESFEPATCHLPPASRGTLSAEPIQAAFRLTLPA